MYSKNTECRMCGKSALVRFLDLGSQPLANSFLREEDLGKEELIVPLEVYLCQTCNLVQLLHVVSPGALFRDYVYFSSGMPNVSSHWQQYTNDVTSRFLNTFPKIRDLVVEVGSNDGVLLSCFKEAGFRVLGIDPAENIAKLANERGIPTISEFFSNKIAQEIRNEKGFASAILANNVFAHINDLPGFMHGVDALLAQKGVLVIEAPYLLDMFKNLAYDTVYHEHLSYLAVRPLVQFFAKFGFEIFEVHLVKAQGTSIRVFVGRKGKHEIKLSVFRCIAEELRYHLDQEASYQRLTWRIERSREALQERLIVNKVVGNKKTAAYGAPAKGNTLLNYCGIGPDIIDYALEDLPSKQGLYTPGMHIPVVDRAHYQQNPPDYFLLLAWNYQDAIFEKEKEFIARGGKFIIPIGDDIAII